MQRYVGTIPEDKYTQGRNVNSNPRKSRGVHPVCWAAGRNIFWKGSCDPISRYPSAAPMPKELQSVYGEYLGPRWQLRNSRMRGGVACDRGCKKHVPVMMRLWADFGLFILGPGINIHGLGI